MPTVKQPKDRARAHNRRRCIRLSQRKAGLLSSLASVSNAPQPAAPTHQGNAQQKKKKKKKRIVSALVSTGGGGSSSSTGMMPGNLLGGGGAGNSVGQKNLKKKLKKQKAA
jgi:hypothetical protein